MKLTQRQINTFLFGLLVFATSAGLIDAIMRNMSPNTLVGYASGVLFSSGLLVAYRRGWEYARYVMTLMTTLAVASIIEEPFVSQSMDLMHVVPMVVTLVLTGPRFLLFSATLFMVILLARAGWSGVYTAPVNLITYVFLTGGMALSRLAVDNALHLAEANRRTEEERTRAEMARELAQQRAAELETRNAEQTKLLQLVSDLEMPAIGIADGVLLAPLVGSLDSARAQTLTRRLLERVAEQRVRLVILDIAGVTSVDTAVARHLVNIAQALRLLGCRVAISGISPSVAVALAGLGVDLPGVLTCRSPQQALMALEPGGRYSEVRDH